MLCWVLVRVAVPSGFWVHPVWWLVAGLCFAEAFPPARSDPALLYFQVFTCFYPVSPAWAAGLPLGI